MTYVQLCRRGIPAYVEHGNTLSLERFAGSCTPTTTDFHRLHGRLFPESTGTGDAEIFAEPGEQLVLLQLLAS